MCSLTAFLFYAAAVVGAAIVLIVQFIPLYGQSHVMVYIGVCSLIGSLSVRDHSIILHVVTYIYRWSENIHDRLQTGYERQGAWNSVETHFFWNESIRIPANMGLHCDSSYVRDNTNELSKQGK